jgi:acid phosphatase
LIRHSSILGNDDEFEQTMDPFIQKIYSMDKDQLPGEGEWSWLRDWQCPIVEENLEVISDRGKRDAKVSSTRIF